MHIHLNVEGQDVILRTPTVNLGEQFRGGIGHLSEIYFKFPPDLIHPFSKEDESNLLE